MNVLAQVVILCALFSPFFIAGYLCWSADHEIKVKYKSLEENRRKERIKEEWWKIRWAVYDIEREKFLTKLRRSAKI